MTEQTATTPAAAAEKLDSLIANPEFRTKLLASGAAETREFHELMAAKSSGENKLDKIIAGTAEVPWLETTMNGELSTYKIASTVSDLRERGLDDATIKQAMESHPISKTEFDAVKRLHAERLGNAEWTSKLLKGGATERRELTLMEVALACGYK
jgi:hypothetical protein